MERFSSLLAVDIGDNTVQALLVAILIFLGFSLIFPLFVRLTVVRLRATARKTGLDIESVLISLLENIGLTSYIVVSLYIATRSLNLSAMIHNAISTIFIIAAVYQSIRIVQGLLMFSLRKLWHRSEEESEYIASMLSIVINIGLWSIGIILILSNIGVNVTSLVAGLGIGGAAVALAVQNILGDIFSSFSIYLDKPFKTGDFIVVGDTTGTVKRIGLKTTRIQSLQGEEIILSNRELTSSKVQNYKRMQNRRVEFFFSVDYTTPIEQLERLPEAIRDILELMDLIKVDRVHVQAFADFGMKITVVYFIQTGDYSKYMDLQQAMNIGILKLLRDEDIKIAMSATAKPVGKPV